MAYTAPNILDQSVQYPNRFQLTEVSAGVYDIVPAFGTITEAGTAVNRALLQPMADEIAAIKYVKIKEYASVSNGVTQIDLDVSDIDFSLYAEVFIAVRDFYRTTAGSSNLGVRINNDGGSGKYGYSYLFRGGTSSNVSSATSFFSNDSLVDFTESTHDLLNIRVSAAGNYAYVTADFGRFFCVGYFNNGSALTLSTINFFAYTANILKSGMKFYVYGVLK